MATYTLISSNVLSSSAASVTFSAIPATYTDLVIRASIRSNQAGNVDPLKLQINGLTTTIYSSTFLYGNGASAGNGTQVNEADLQFFPSEGNNPTSSTFSSIEIYIPSYTVSQNKPVSGFSATENNGTTAYVGITAGLIRSTATISSILLAPVNSTFVSGSSFYLYGISNA